MKNIALIVIVCLLCSFYSAETLKGTWEFIGGEYNGKKEGAPTEYKLQRKYDAAGYDAFAIEKGFKPEKYESGTYILKGDTCVDTETFCSQPSKITNIPVLYHYSVQHDTLTLTGMLPTGMYVKEFWKKVK